MNGKKEIQDVASTNCASSAAYFTLTKNDLARLVAIHAMANNEGLSKWSIADHAQYIANSLFPTTDKRK